MIHSSLKNVQPEQTMNSEPKADVPTFSPAIANTPVVGSTVYLMDCVEGMKHYPDKYFDLAVVDPPYGIEDKISKGGGSHTKSKTKFHQMYSENGKQWDRQPPLEYWVELFRVSRNQIIWGGNYFDLPPCRCFLIWDKVRFVDNFSNLELAWTSFDKHAKKFEYCGNAGFVLKPIDTKIHPTQKPVALYDFCFQFADIQPGMRVLDTHLGSGSSRITADKAGVEFVGFEIDSEYYDLSEKRYKKYKQQLRIVGW